MIRRLPNSLTAGLAFFLLTILFISADRARAQNGSLSLDAYRSQLGEIRHAVASQDMPSNETLAELAGMLTGIRAVSLPGGSTVTVDHAYLAGMLTAEPPQTDLFLSLTDSILLSLGTARPGETDQADLGALAVVLAAPEFQWEEAGPNPLQEFLRMSLEGLIRLIVRLFPNISNYSGLFNALLAGLLAGVLAAVLYGVYRASMRSILRDVEAAQDDSLPDSLTADQALAHAQELSGTGELRTAVRYLYLSALLELESRGLIRIDRSRTNHEVVSDLLQRPKVARDLEEVVEIFDRVWYGYQKIDHPTFNAYADKVRRLKSMQGVSE